MVLEHTTYHRLLRVSAVVVALVLLFDSGLLSETTERLSTQTQEYLVGAVGMSVSVQPNEFNQITAELTAQKRALDEREALLAQREIEVELNSGSTNSDYSTYVLASILFILLVLIVLNYTLDYLRAHEDEPVAA